MRLCKIGKIMKLTFLGGVGEVTGVRYLLEAKADSKKTVKILVDCGMLQGGKDAHEKNYEPFPFDAKEINYLFITHAHIDHVGLAPKLYKYGFRGKVLMTPPTKDLSEITLLDSCRILERESWEKGVDPIFKEEDAKGILGLIKTVNYGRKNKLEGKVYFRLNDAGHMLGSSIIEIWAEGKKIVFSGDLGNAPTPLLECPKKIKEADYILVESTYGNKIHENREQRKENLENIIEETYNNKGVLMIPAFAVERTQELLCELDELAENCRIPRMPVFIDSPMAIKATEIYKKYPKYFNKEAKKQILAGDNFFKFPGLVYTPDASDSKNINRISPPKIIIAGSGMSTGGRILFHEKLYLPDFRSCLLITNYQVEGTLGRRLLEGEKEIKIFEEPIQVKARVASIQGYSSHADQKAIYGWLSNFKKPVKHIWTVQGEPESSEALALLIEDHLGIPTSAPKIGDIVDL